jgi:hypothetical protein
MQREDDELTEIERLALREVLAGIRQVIATTGYGSVTLFVRDSEPDRTDTHTSKKLA